MSDKPDVPSAEDMATRVALTVYAASRLKRSTDETFNELCWLLNDWKEQILAVERDRACAILTPPSGQTIIMPINEFCENARSAILSSGLEATP